MRTRLLPIFLLVVLLVAYIDAYAYNYTVHKKDLGEIAESIIGVEMAVNSFVRFLFTTAGIGLVFASIYHFKLWSQNRLHRPFSRPLLFLVFGLALIGLVYIPMFIPK